MAGLHRSQHMPTAQPPPPSASRQHRCRDGLKLNKQALCSDTPLWCGPCPWAAAPHQPSTGRHPTLGHRSSQLLTLITKLNPGQTLRPLPAPARPCPLMSAPPASCPTCQQPRAALPAAISHLPCSPLPRHHPSSPRGAAEPTAPPGAAPQPHCVPCPAPHGHPWVAMGSPVPPCCSTSSQRQLLGVPTCDILAQAGGRPLCPAPALRYG